MSDERNEPTQQDTKRSDWEIWPESWFVGVILLLVTVLALGPMLGSSIARDLILISGGVVGLGLAAWRSSVLQQQAKIQQKNLNHSQQVARRDSRFEIKRLAMEQLASDEAIVRQAGVLALITAMEDRDEERPLELAALLSNYIGRSKVEEGEPGEDPIPPSREHFKDAVAALRLFGAEERRHRGLKGEPLVRLNLKGVWLQRANLSNLHLAGLDATGADLERANFYGTNLVEARFDGASLVRATLVNADLRRASLSVADLVAEGLDQS